MSASLSRRLQGYLAGRTAVLVVLLTLAAVFQTRPAAVLLPFAWFFIASALSFGFTLASVLALRAGQGAALTLRLQPMWDVAYATVLVYLSGGVYSPFSTLYPLAIIGAAILLLRRGALVVATASSLAYGLLVDLQFYGLIRPLNPFPVWVPEGADVALQLLFKLAAFYAVAFLAGYLAEELRRTGERLVAAESEVLDLEHLKESILHSMTSGLIAVDPRGCELFHNDAADKLFRWAGVELRPGLALGHIFDLGGGERNEVRLGDDAVFGYSVSRLVDRAGQERGRIVVFQDLTAVKELEEDLRRTDRLAAVGRLAAGLAHEIRNPLASLAGSVEVLRGEVGAGSGAAPLFEIVLRETDRLNRLVTNFLHYARPGSAARTPVALRELVAEVGFFFSHGEGRDGFRLDNQVPADLVLEADRAQLEQLLLNLLRNSCEAAPGGVQVTVTAGRGEDAVWLEVADDGPGLSARAAERAFEPFFTDRAGGTGLGLATVHRVVENHGGTVELGAAAGGGAVLRFRFPAPEPAAGQGAGD